MHNMWNQAEGNGANQTGNRSVLLNVVFTVKLLYDLLIIKAEAPLRKLPSTLPPAELLKHAAIRVF
jgi:hypothetical protein